MGLPQDMSGAYEEASLLHRVQRELHRAGGGGGGSGDSDGASSGKRLLLIHGLLDDNVHARHALLLLQQLQQAQQQHVSLCVWVIGQRRIALFYGRCVFGVRTCVSDIAAS